MDTDDWLARIVKADRIYLESETATNAYRQARDEQIRKAHAAGVSYHAISRAIKEANGRGGGESTFRWAAMRAAAHDGARPA